MHQRQAKFTMVTIHSSIHLCKSLCAETSRLSCRTRQQLPGAADTVPVHKQYSQTHTPKLVYLNPASQNTTRGLSIPRCLSGRQTYMFRWFSNAIQLNPALHDTKSSCNMQQCRAMKVM